MNSYLKRGAMILTVWMLALIAGSLSGCDATSREMNHLIGYFDLRATWIPRESMIEGEEHRIYHTYPEKGLTLLECREHRITLERHYRTDSRSRLGYYEKSGGKSERGRVRFECVRTSP